jgi:hypothetical protein
MQTRVLGLVDDAEAVGLDFAQNLVSAYVMTVAAHVNRPARKPAGLAPHAMKPEL